MRFFTVHLCICNSPEYMCSPRLLLYDQNLGSGRSGGLYTKYLYGTRWDWWNILRNKKWPLCDFFLPCLGFTQGLISQTNNTREFHQTQSCCSGGILNIYFKILHPTERTPFNIFFSILDSSRFTIDRNELRYQYDPAIIERTIGLVLGLFTALCRSFLKHGTLTNKDIGSIWRALSKPPQRRQGPDRRPLWLLVGTPSAFRPELAYRLHVA